MSGLALLRGPRSLALRAPGLLGPELLGIALADRLFWDRPVGLSLPVFCAGAALLAGIFRLRRWHGRRAGAAGLVLVAALLPSVERFTPLSAAFALAGTLLAVRLAAGPAAADREGLLAGAARDALAGPRRVVRDTLRRRRLAARRRAAPAGRRARWIAWIAPLGLLGVFGALLASANPLIAAWLADVPIPSWPDIVASLPRVLFWLAVLAKLWPLVRARRHASVVGRKPADVAEAPDRDALERLATLLLSPLAVLRALVLLDLAVGLQLGLDGAFLWGGFALPDGMTYAAYAHRGAYPLVATALLAGAVALAIRRPGAVAPSGSAAPLLLLFLAENVLLVGSAVARLDLYVAAYGLTAWRVAAFAWMGLVAAGLGLIALQGALGRDVRWLLRANALAAVLVLYGWCFLDVPRLVADYDVAHCAEMEGGGPKFDAALVTGLGPEAVPAVDRYLLGFRGEAERAFLIGWRARMARRIRRSMADWRGWSLADRRLLRDLDASGVPEPAVGEDDDDGS